MKLTEFSVVLAGMLPAALAGMPTATVTSVSQGADRVLTVAYTMGEEPGVVTMDVETKAQDGSWSSVGPRALWYLEGDVNRLVTNGTHEITWRPDETGDMGSFDSESARVRLTAWPTNNPPMYMVVDLCAKAEPRVRYYVSEEALPGGLKENPIYKESVVVMRRIYAAGVPWMMGDLSSGAHAVTLDEDFYIGVFELTQAQHTTANGAAATYYYTVEGAHRPSERITYNILRGTTGNSSSAPETDTPQPTASSLLGKLKALTGVEFEMPTEAQWEFAARAGTMSYEWPNGVRISISGDADGNLPGRYKFNGGYDVANNRIYPSDAGIDFATAIVGSYEPNRWGLYDMAGNVDEWCRDWYKADISSLNGACVENKQSTGAASDYYRIIRGGHVRWGAAQCLPTSRNTLPPHGCMDNWGNYVGYRPYAPCCAK